MVKLKSRKCLLSVTLIILLLSIHNHLNAQPESGDWIASTEFGEIVLTVDSEGNYITKLSITFSDYSCGGITQNGTVTKQSSSGWSISNNQFSITTSINPSGTTKLTIQGTFNQSGKEASGTWSINVSGITCSGNWTHSLSNGGISGAQWEGIGPYMGFINSMDMNNQQSDTVYAATPNGLFRTKDGAENWEKLNLPNLEMDKVVVSQSHPNKVICKSKYNVFLSENYGEDWEVIWSDTMIVTCANFNPENPKSIYIGTNEYLSQWINTTQYETFTEFIYRSQDGGGTWNKVSFNGVKERNMPNHVKYIIIDPSDTSRIYVGTDNSFNAGGMFISHNNGVDWFNNYHGYQEVYAMACTPAGYEDHTLCFISYDFDPFKRILLISKDGGMTWEEKIPPSSYDMVGNMNDESTLYISEDFPEFVNFGMEYENDEGTASIGAFNLDDEKWYYYSNSPLEHPTSVLTSNYVDYLGFKNSGVYKNTWVDTIWTWVPKNNGIASVEILDFAYYPDSPEKMLVALKDNLFKTNNFGESWQKLEDTGWNRNSIFIEQNDTTKIIAGTDPDRYLSYGNSFYIYKSDDGGANWNSQKLFTRYGNIQLDYKMWVSEIIGSPANPEMIYMGVDGGDSSSGSGLYRSNDGGATWEKEYSNGVSAIAVDPTNNNIVYLGTTNQGYIYRSEDGGDIWTGISPGGTDAFVTYVWDLAVDSNSDVYAATSSGLFKWEGNEDWSLIQGLPNSNTTSIAIDNSLEHPVYYIGTSDQGVFISSDGTQTWESFNHGLESLNITKLKINDTFPKYLYAGTKNGGVWLTPLQETGIIETEEYISICQGDEYYGHSESGEFQRILSSSAGTDSIVSTYLTVNPTYESEEYASICDGEEYLGLTEEGEHLRLFETVSGCDSTVITNLSFYPKTTVEIINNGDTLKSTGGYQSYQWCDVAGDIAGANAVSYIINKSGDYYLVFTDENGCQQTSESINVILAGIAEKDFELEYSIIPNPNSGKFQLRFNSVSDASVDLLLVNPLGQSVEKRQVIHPNINQIEQFDISHLSKGMYHLIISSDGFQKSEKIVVQ